MAINLKLKQGAEEYRQKFKMGLIKVAKSLNPIQKAKQNPKSLRFAINAKCYDCSGFTRVDVTDCDMPGCELYFLRPWQKPHIKKTVSGSGTPLSKTPVIKKYGCFDQKIEPERFNRRGELLPPYAKLKANPKSLRAAINAFCFWCSCEQRKEVKLCTAVNCPLLNLRPWQPKKS
jgi:hypothetical protein